MNNYHFNQYVVTYTNKNKDKIVSTIIYADSEQCARDTIQQWADLNNDEYTILEFKSFNGYGFAASYDLSEASVTEDAIVVNTLIFDMSKYITKGDISTEEASAGDVLLLDSNGDIVWAPITSTGGSTVSGALTLSNISVNGNTLKIGTLSYTPTISQLITESNITEWGFTKNIGTITEIKLNGTSKGTSGSINLDNIIIEGDTRLSDTRTPKAHTHTKSEITDLSSIPITSIDTSSITVGSTKIKLKLTNGKLSLVIDEPIEVTLIVLDNSSLNLVIGDTRTLTATVTPSDATDLTITWSSNNTSIATVDSAGLVTAIAEGSAIITATSVNSKTAICSVTVNASEDTTTIETVY